MAHNGNGIINANINQNYGANLSIGANSNFGIGDVDTREELKGSEKSGILDAGYDFVRGEKTNKANTTMGNFQEYMRDKQEKAKEAGEDQASKEKEALEQAKKISQSVSGEELRQLEMMGIDVETANMTDLMGMVNTLRYNQETQETAELMAKIAVDKGKVGSVAMIGGNVTVGNTQVSGVSVEDVLVAENKVAEDIKQPPLKDYGSDGIKLSDTEAIYLLKNNMNVSKENIYKAHYSGIKLADGVGDKILGSMESQLEKVIEQAGLDVDKESMDTAKLLVNNEVPVTTDNLKKYMEMKPFMGLTPEEAGILDKVAAVTKEQLDDKAAKLYNEVKSIDIKQVYQMAAEGKTVTIASAVKYSKLWTKEEQIKPEPLDSGSVDFNDQKAVTAMRQMEEIRLSMTSAMAGKLIKMDMNVDTRELSKVVSMLKNIELRMAKDAFYAAGVNPTEEDVSLYQEVSAKVNAIGKADAGIVAAPLMGEAFTIEGLHRRITPVMAGDNGAMEGQLGQGSRGQEVDVQISKSQMDAVRRSYEAVGTAPRRDMGDSISKAFGNVKDILTEMNMPVNYETERAVRILGYNQLEITEENINQIIDYDRQVNDMLNTFYPEAVIGMIKDGINPLDVPIDELNKKIRDKNYNNGVTEAKNFAAYLRDMEKQGELTPEVRESYIGMYRVMEKLSKSGDREAGYLFANGSRLTVRNLITAMRSRKAAGVDVGIDDNFGMLQDINVNGKKMDDQIAGAFESVEVAQSDYEISLEDAYKLLEADVEKFMTDNSVEISAVNIRAVHAMINQPGSVYSLVSELLSKMKFRTDSTKELLDQEMENITDSIAGEEIPVDFTLSSILESLRGSEEMSLKYDDLREKLTDMMYQWGVAGSLTQMDIATIKTVNAGFNVMSGMAKQDKFQIPVDTEQGTKVMNLTIKKDGSNPGLVQINMKTENYGEITANVKSDDSGNLVGEIVADNSDGNYALKETQEKLKDAIKSAGYVADAVEVGSVSQIDMMSYKGITSEKLYQVSVSLVKAMASIM